MRMQTQPKPGSYLWKGVKAFGSVAWGEAAQAGRDIQNTFQAVLWSGWSTQAAHNASSRATLHQAVEDDFNRIERAAEVTRDGPEKA